MIDTPGLAPKKRRALFIAARFAAAGMVLSVLGIFAFILRSERAHDEARCPFVAGEVRDVDPGVQVQEQWRSCQDGVQERRWLILRSGESPREFARRRLHAEAFEARTYEWSVRPDAQGKLILDVHTEGAPDIEVLEARLLEQ